MKTKEKIEKALAKSKKDCWSIRLKSSFPDKDNFDGIVLHYSSEVIVLHEMDNFVFDGIVFLNRIKIIGVRDEEYEKCSNAIIRDNRSIKDLSKLKWIRKISNFQFLLSEIMKKKVWPAVEMVSKRSKGFYVGPITVVDENKFGLYCYDATGKWEKEYELEYKGIGKVEIQSKYTDNFNGFMERNNSFSDFLKSK